MRNSRKVPIRMASHGGVSTRNYVGKMRGKRLEHSEMRLPGGISILLMQMSTLGVWW